MQVVSTEDVKRLEKIVEKIQYIEANALHQGVEAQFNSVEITKDHLYIGHNSKILKKKASAINPMEVELVAENDRYYHEVQEGQRAYYRLENGGILRLQEIVNTTESAFAYTLGEDVVYTLPEGETKNLRKVQLISSGNYTLPVVPNTVQVLQNSFANMDIGTLNVSSCTTDLFSSSKSIANSNFKGTTQGILVINAYQWAYYTQRVPVITKDTESTGHWTANEHLLVQVAPEE